MATTIHLNNQGEFLLKKICAGRPKARVIKDLMIDEMTRQSAITKSITPVLLSLVQPIHDALWDMYENEKNAAIKTKLWTAYRSMFSLIEGDF